MKKIHVSGQYFLNHDLEPAELTTQLAAIAQAGFENLYAHSRAGMITPYTLSGMRCHKPFIFEIAAWFCYPVRYQR